MIAAVILAALVVIVLAQRARHRAKAPAIVTETVERRDIALTIEATGSVEPIDLVEIKSKASGQIVRMPVQVGSTVKAGDLLVQIDPRDVNNEYAQSLAALRAAQAKVTISAAQKKRADDLFAQAVITAPEHETAVLDYANAQSALVAARTDLELARQRREDATVRAPVAGTVLSQPVSSGQVISSATSSASGGTSLLTMADLKRIRLRALVAETDVGNLRMGLAANVTVDAFPNRTFAGTVEKIEPQAVVQQSVTMFPVLISLANENGLLLPGMNGEVTMLVDRRQNVPAVPVDAIRTAREVAVVAPALGLDPDSVRAQVQRQAQAMMAARAARYAAAGDSAGGRGVAGASGFGGSGGDSSGFRRGMRRGWAGATGDTSRFRRGMRGGNGGGGRGGFAGFSAAGGQGAGGFAGGGFGGGARASRAQVVFVKTAKGIEPRAVRIGLSDFDYAEVLDGVQEGEQVVMLGVAEAQASREQTQQRIRQRVGSGPLGTPGGGGGGGARGGGGGGSRGGGGG